MGARPVSVHRRRQGPEVGILWTWKGIAAYFGVGLNTVHRWHRARPFPLSRIGPYVCLPKSAADQWVLRRPVDEARQR